MEEALQKLDAFFNPRSVAIIGATKKVDKAGHVIFKNFSTNKMRGVFKGELYPVNLNEDSILGFKCYPSLTNIPDEVDLIVIIVPATVVPSIMEEAVTKKVKAAIIITAGFKEVGNAELEEQVVAIAKRGGIRVLGPNCLGVYYSKTGIDSLFLPETKILTTGEEVVATPRPLAGNIAMITQSGAFGSAALDYLTGRQMGVSKFVSFGNKCDVNETDILHYLLYDEETKVALVYLEDIIDGREFLEVVKQVTLKKPVPFSLSPLFRFLRPAISPCRRSGHRTTLGLDAVHEVVPRADERLGAITLQLSGQRARVDADLGELLEKVVSVAAVRW